ncbi:MAG: DUF642 domain-containing protein, partial [Verrucomicrobiales bacterium]|nr:DUF642 domain-containing protein [Verrucomicrobiales bacterium]
MSANAANLIANGSFESPDLGAAGISFSTPAGWGGSGALTAIIAGQYGPLYPLAHSGRQFVALGANSSTLSQQFTIARAGTYTLEWFDSSEFNGPRNSARYTVSVGGINRDFDANAAGINTWKKHAVQMTLSAGQHTVQFTSRAAQNGEKPLIDDVAIEGDLIDLVAVGLAWNTTIGGVDARYRVDGGALREATTASLFWANGENRENMLPGFPPIATPVAIEAGTGGPGSQGEITFNTPGVFFETPPPEATHILLILDSIGALHPEHDAKEDNNSKPLALGRPDLVATLLEWDPANAGVEFSYDVGVDLKVDTTVELWWSNGPNWTDVPTDRQSVYSTIIERPRGTYGPFYVPSSVLGTAPDGATHLLLVVDPPLTGSPNGLFDEGIAENNNVYPLRNRPDIAATSLEFHSYEGGVDDVVTYNYEVSRIALDKPLLVNLYWATGPTLAESLLPIAFTAVLTQPADLSVKQHFQDVLVKDMPPRPAEAKYLLLVFDRDGAIAESDETNNLFPEPVGCAPPITGFQMSAFLRRKYMTRDDDMDPAFASVDNMDVLIEESIKAGLDPRFILGIAGAETVFGRRKTRPQISEARAKGFNFWNVKFGSTHIQCDLDIKETMKVEGEDVIVRWCGWTSFSRAVRAVSAYLRDSPRYRFSNGDHFKLVSEFARIYSCERRNCDGPFDHPEAWARRVEGVMCALGYPKSEVACSTGSQYPFTGSSACLKVHSPVSLYVIDPQGRRYGHNCEDGFFYREIAGVVPSEEEGSLKGLWLPNFVDGNYTVVL